MSKKILIPKEMLNSVVDAIIDSNFIEVYYGNSPYVRRSILKVLYESKNIEIIMMYPTGTKESYDAFNAIIAHIYKEANSLNNQIQ